jgi:DNA-binding NarL/FixJ family response regulator
MEAAPLRVYLVDDEPLAIERLERLLAKFDGLRIAGSTTDPAEALRYLSDELIDVLFLDIHKAVPGSLYIQDCLMQKAAFLAQNRQETALSRRKAVFFRGSCLLSR